jgi:iron complex transport system substrate-binding protein
LQLLNVSRKCVQAARITNAFQGPVDRLSSSRDTQKSAGFLFTNSLNFKLRSASIALVLCALWLAQACSPGTSPPTSTRENARQVVDEAGRKVTLPLKIERIVSLAPNLTEIVYAVGAGSSLVGDTEYCDYPAEAKSVAKIGDTMHPSVERIIALKPQIVLVSTASQLEAFTKQLDEQGIAVYVTNPHSLDEVFRSIETLGDLFGHHDWALTVAQDLRSRAAAVEVATRTVQPIKVFYQVSGEPLYTIGREAYLTDLVRRAGGVSVTADVPGAFPRFSDEAALAAQPEAIILPSGGSMGTANSTVAPALKNSPAAVKNRIYKINDDHLSRPGPRLVDGLEEMARALHPEVSSQFGPARVDEHKTPTASQTPKP